jgi:hypothetical protein
MRMRLFALVIAAVVMALGSLPGCTGTPATTETGNASTTIKVTETVGVIQTPQVPNAPTINVAETIGVIDSPVPTTSQVIKVLESIGVAESPGMLLPVVIKVTESIGTADSNSLNTNRRLAPPTIISFTSDPEHIFRGSSSILDWNVTGALTVTIDHDIGSVAASGRRVVSPFNTTTYTLTATNAAGSVYATVTITVTILRF